MLEVLVFPSYGVLLVVGVHETCVSSFVPLFYYQVIFETIPLHRYILLTRVVPVPKRGGTRVPFYLVSLPLPLLITGFDSWLMGALFIINTLRR